MIVQDLSDLVLGGDIQQAGLSQLLNGGIVRSKQGDILCRCDLLGKVGILFKQADQGRQAVFAPKQCSEVLVVLCRGPEGKCCCGYDCLAMHVGFRSDVKCTSCSDRAMAQKREESETAGYLLRSIPAVLSYAIDLDPRSAKSLAHPRRSYHWSPSTMLDVFVPEFLSIADQMLLVDAKIRGQTFAIGFTLSAGLRTSQVAMYLQTAKEIINVECCATIPELLRALSMKIVELSICWKLPSA